MPPLPPLLPIATRAAGQRRDPLDLPAPRPPADPLGLFEPIKPYRPQKSRRTRLTPEDERSLWQNALTGVQWLGETLDKPGATVRGLIGGATDLAQGRSPDWGGGLLNLVPFSDTMGLTDPEERVSGWDILEDWGVPKGKSGFDWWDVPKFGFEVVTDPMFWSTGPLGTFTKQGLEKFAAKQADELAQLAKGGAKTIAEAGEEVTTRAKGLRGVSERSLADLPPGSIPTPAAAIEAIRRGDRALWGLRSPVLKNRLFPIGMSDEAAISFGTGEWAANLTEKLFYGGGGPLGHYATWLPRTMTQLYRGATKSHLHGKFGAMAQRAADIGFAEAQLGRDAVTELLPHMGQLDRLLGERYAKAAETHLKTGTRSGQDAYQDFMRMATERMELAAGELPTPEALQEIANRTLQLGLNQTLPELVGSANELTTGTLKYLDALQRMTEIPAYKDLIDLGSPVQLLDDLYAFHYGRRPSNTGILKEHGKRVSGSFFQYGLARGKHLRDIPGGTFTINQLARNEVYRGYVLTDAAQQSTKKTVGKGLHVGQPVRDMGSDRIGYVWDINKKGNRAQVHFENAVSKQASDQWLNEDLLVPLEGLHKSPERFWKKLDDKEHSRLLRGVLELAGVDVPEKASRAQLRKLYLEYGGGGKHWPGFRRLIGDEWQNTPTRQRLDGTEVTLDDEIAEWFGVEKPKRYQSGANKGEIVLDDAGNAVMESHTPRIEEIDRYFSRLPGNVTATGLFDRSVLNDWHDYMTSIIDAQSTMRSAHALMDAPGALVKAGATGLPPGAVPLDEAWKSAGFTDKGLERIAAKFAPGKDVAEWVAGQGLSREAFNALRSFGEAMQPKNSNVLVDVLDKVMAYYKGHLTLPFLSFHGRNLTSNFNLAYTEGRVGMKPLAVETGQFFNYALGRKVNEDTLRLIQEGIGNGAITSHKGLPMDISGHVAHETLPPGFARDALRSRTKEGRRLARLERGWSDELYAERSWANRTLDFLFGTRRRVPDELAEQGVQAMPVSPLMDMGEKLYQLVEGAGRSGYYVALRKKGFSAAEAKHLVDKALYDYTNLSKMDQYARRLFPFWQWRKLNIPAQIRKVFDRPAEQVAKIRAYSTASQQEEYTPSWIAEGLGIPLFGSLDKAPEGGRSYIRALGDPLEDINLFALESGKPGKRTIEKLASGMAPPLVAFGERLTGREWYSGRDLKELQPVLGQEPGTDAHDALSMLLLETPVSRYFTEYYQKPLDWKWLRDRAEEAGVSPGVLDTLHVKGRKAAAPVIMNLLSGVKTSTVEDLEKQKIQDFIERLTAQVEEEPYVRTYERPYVPKRFREEGLGLEQHADIQLRQRLIEELTSMRER